METIKEETATLSKELKSLKKLFRRIYYQEIVMVILVYTLLLKDMGVMNFVAPAFCK